MGLGVKNLEKRESAFTRKIVLIGIAVLCILFGVGISLVLNITQTESTTYSIFKVFGYVALPILLAAYILSRYYEGLIRKK